MEQRPRILYIATVSMSTIFFRGQLSFMQKGGFDVAVCTSPGKELDEIAEKENARAFAIPMQREISPFKDIVSLWRLYRLMRSYKPAIVNAGTPKAGLLGMLAARLAGVPARIYLLRGLRLETTHGAKRFILATAERLASACASTVVCECRSLQRVYIKLGLVRPEKSIVLGEGSSNGVDTSRFKPDDQTREEAHTLRAKLGIPDGAAVVGFVGRLTRDKGIEELARSFKKILQVLPETRLLIVGDYESQDAVSREAVDWLADNPQVIRTSFVPDTKPYYALIDVLAFPTHREGFGAVATEAASMQVPVVGFEVTGVMDAVHNGATGKLVARGDVEAFTAAIVEYLRDPNLRAKHGKAGRRRMLDLFGQEAVWRAWMELYLQVLSHPAPGGCN